VSEQEEIEQRKESDSRFSVLFSRSLGSDDSSGFIVGDLGEEGKKGRERVSPEDEGGKTTSETSKTSATLLACRVFRALRWAGVVLMCSYRGPKEEEDQLNDVFAFPSPTNELLLPRELVGRRSERELTLYLSKDPTPIDAPPSAAPLLQRGISVQQDSSMPVKEREQKGEESGNEERRSV